MDKLKEFVELKLQLQKQIHIHKILTLQMEVLKNEDIPAHHRTAQYDILGEAIKLIKEEEDEDKASVAV